jgi:hypothetical protein
LVTLDSINLQRIIKLSLVSKVIEDIMEQYIEDINSSLSCREWVLWLNLL